MKTQCILFVLLFPVAWIGCKVKSSDAGHTIQQRKNGVQVRAKFIGGNLFETNQLPQTTSPADRASADYLFFDIQLSRLGFEPDKKTVEYLNFGLQNDFSMAVGTDTLMPALVQRLANGRKDVFEYVVAFEKDNRWKNSEDNVVIVYDDNVFGLGQHFFSFQKQDILTINGKTN